MDKHDKKQIFSNFIWGTFSVLLMYLINFFSIPYIINKLGMESYGFVNLAHTIISYIDIIVIALNAFATRYIAIEYHNNNYKKANEYYSSVLFANIIIMIVIGILSFFTILFLPSIINIPANLTFDVQILFTIVLLNYFLNLGISIFSMSAFIKNKTSITSKIKGFSGIVYAILILIIITCFELKVYSFVMANLISAVISIFANFYFSKRILPDLKFSIKDFNFKRIKELISSGIWNTINNIGGLLNTGLDLIVTNKTLDNIAMGEISVGKQFSNIITIISSVSIDSFKPKQLEMYSKGKKEELVSLLVNSMKISGIIGIIFFSCFITLGQDFFNIWLEGQDCKTIYILCIIVLSLDIISIFLRPLYYVYTLTNKLRLSSFISIFAGLLNFILMISFIPIFQDYGKYIVVGSTTVVGILTAWINTYLPKKYLNIKKNIFFKSLIRHLVVCLISSFVCYAIYKLLPGFNNYLGFVFYGGFFVIISASIAFLGEFGIKKSKQIVIEIDNKIKRNKN